MLVCSSKGKTSVLKSCFIDTAVGKENLYIFMAYCMADKGIVIEDKKGLGW